MSAVKETAGETKDLGYQEIRAIARRLIFNESSRCTLTGTELVHEVYLKLRRSQSAGAVRSYGFAAKVMRQILVDRARARKTRDRAAVTYETESRRQQTDPTKPRQVPSSELMLCLNQAVDKLEMLYPAHAELAKLKLFSGLSIEESCEQLSLPRSSGYRYWEFAKAFLARELG